MEQRKINELRRRNARVVIKAGIPFKVFYDEDLNNDQISEVMNWCEEADEEDLLPIEVEEMTEEEKMTARIWKEAFDEYGKMHQNLLMAIRSEKDYRKGLHLMGEYAEKATNYADEVCRKKGLKK